MPWAALGAAATLTAISAFTPRAASAAPVPALKGGAVLTASTRTAAAAADPTVPTLFHETFTGATADEFTAVGSACLTGAHEGVVPPAGDHALGGCPPELSTGPVPPNGAAPRGYLRLTDASNDQSGAALYNTPLPANGGLDITFEAWQYGKTDLWPAAPPADGLSFFLVDGTVPLTHPGAFGGSLGYAQKLPDDNPAAAILPGVEGGYLGVGLDTLGNYFGDWEHRSNGCPQAERSPAGTAFRAPAPGENMITLRGPEFPNSAGVEGYCFLAATTTGQQIPSMHPSLGSSPQWESSLPALLEGPTTEVSSDPATAEQDLEPSRRIIHIVLTPGPAPHLTVTIDFLNHPGVHEVLSEPAPTPEPSLIKFGFAASTGLFTSIHLIRNVVIKSEAPLPELDLVKDVEQPHPAHLVAGDHVHYVYTVTNTGPGDVSALDVTDDKTGLVTCDETTLAVDETATCHATYTVTPQDVTAGHISNTAVAEGTAHGTSITSNQASKVLELTAPPGIMAEITVLTPGPHRAGHKVRFSYRVRNTGGVPLTRVHVIDDHVTGITCSPTTIAPFGSPGDSTQCEGTYVITHADEVNGKVTNHATALGTAPDGAAIVSPQAYATLPIAPARITLSKRAETTGPFFPGETVRYSYTVTDTGLRELRGLGVLDSRVFPVTCAATRLAPGHSTVCHGTYRITAADAKAGQVTNLAQATASDPSGNIFQTRFVKVTIPVLPSVPVTG